MLLDMKTIIFSYVLTDIVCMLVIVLLWRQNRKRLAGSAFWVFNYAFQITALFLILLRGQISAWLSFVAANTLVIAGSILGYMGLLRFIGKKSFQIHNYVLLAAFALVHAYFTFVQPNQAARNLNMSVGLLIICFQCAWLLLYRVESGMRQLTRGVGIVFAAYCILSVARIVEYFASSHSTGDYLQSGIFEQLVLISNQMLFILITYFLVLMFNKRLLLDIGMQEEKFSKAFHSSPYAILITRLTDGKIIEVNDGFFKITGYQWADVKATTTIAMHLWDKDEDRALVVSELASNSMVHEREFQFRKKSGEIITGLFSAELISINNEFFVLSSINDITERKLAEDAIKEITAVKSELIAKFNDAEHIAKIGSWEWNLQTNNVWWSDETYLLFGVTKQDFVPGFEENGKFIHPDDFVLYGKSFEHSLRTGEPLNVDLRLIASDGRLKYCHAAGEVIFDDSGQKNRFIGTIMDISEHKWAEESLHKSEERYRNLILNLDAGIVVHAPDTSIVMNNARASELLGISDEQMRGKTAIDPAWRFVNWDDIPLPFDDYPVNRIVNSKSPIKNQIFKIYDPGKNDFVWLTVNGFPVLNNKGEIIEIVISFIDITARKQTEKDIISLNAELENNVAQRTRDLRESQLALLNIVEDLNASNKQVAVVNQSLETTNKELEAFSYSVSHDLRAPLRSVDAYAQMIEEDYAEKLDDEGRRLLQVIRDSAHDMGQLIADLLAFSRLSRKGLQMGRVGMSELVTKTRLQVEQAETGRAIRWDIGELPPAFGDEAMIREALINLLANAVKYTRPRQDAAIGISGRVDGDDVVYCVTDNGVGFDMAYKDKLFCVFQRLHATAEFEGTGIGLALVQRIVQRHGGRVWAEGKVNEGATFYFSLPVKANEEGRM